MLLFKLSKFFPGLKSQVSEMGSINLLLWFRELKQKKCILSELNDCGRNPSQILRSNEYRRILVIIVVFGCQDFSQHELKMVSGKQKNWEKTKKQTSL